ncbi:hypothetical protein [Mesorhizobium sp. B2-2-2]|uniref:hypothetical protein n=1 Tax=Mesorhizobium sp. B2-2-2 TaxID=2589964 RepID=UPI001FED35BC|nr:hypothetical protein [Mesorhizobium sp. B2-2-2]
MALPAWSASMVQVPAESNVTELPLTVHTAVVVEVKATIRPEEVVALSVTGPLVNAAFAGCVKLIVCVPLAIVPLTVWLAVKCAGVVLSTAWTV